MRNFHVAQILCKSNEIHAALKSRIYYSGYIGLFFLLCSRLNKVLFHCLSIHISTRDCASLENIAFYDHLLNKFLSYTIIQQISSIYDIYAECQRPNNATLRPWQIILISVSSPKRGRKSKLSMAMRKEVKYSQDSILRNPLYWQIKTRAGRNRVMLPE